jgi:hypothetical protein
LHLQGSRSFEGEDVLQLQKRSLLLQESVFFLQKCVGQLLHELLQKQDVEGDLSLDLSQLSSIRFEKQTDRSRV